MTETDNIFQNFVNTARRNETQSGHIEKFIKFVKR